MPDKAKLVLRETTTTTVTATVTSTSRARTNVYTKSFSSYKFNLFNSNMSKYVLVEKH